MKNSMEVPQKTEYRVTIWSTNSTPGHISGQNYNSKDTYTLIFTATLFTISQAWKQPKSPSVDEWIQMDAAICSNMDGPRDYHTKWAKSEKHKYYMVSLICGIWTMTQMKLSAKQKLTIDTENRHMVAKGTEDWGRRDWELWISRWQSIIYTMDKQGPTI